MNDETGQSVQKDILCQPTEENLYKIYEQYNDQLRVRLEDLPSCKDFTPNKIPYHSLWESIFVKPLAWIILQAGYFKKFWLGRNVGRIINSFDFISAIN